MKNIDRSTFIKKTALGGMGVILAPFQSCAGQKYPDPVNHEIVKEFVSIAHKSFDKTKEMLENDSRLLHVSWDWGGGDYETALDAAAHMGNQELVRYLLGIGARLNLFAASMLGYLDVVKPAIERQPKLIHAKGPHGFTLLHHAKVGGNDSEAVFEYLSSKGAQKLQLDFYK